ncbi:hypothetical protein PoB_002336000 [Plakobranchus ocellatus]|uniref:Uncharacterized protein n=1 Tax=Plakobranchus ocellatus TaxID=259542 RepID=A0AAV3ZNX3_9GAST|nr:hypothetical protein PoB_002336000 [Plakobranchus ocellatus]
MCIASPHLDDLRAFRPSLGHSQLQPAPASSSTMMVMRFCSSARRRWKALLWLLLMLVVLLNAVVFVSMPGAKVSGDTHAAAAAAGERSEPREFGPGHGIGASHLQVGIARSLVELCFRGLTALW